MKKGYFLMTLVMTAAVMLTACSDEEYKPPVSSDCDILAFKTGSDVWLIEGTNITYLYPAGKTAINQRAFITTSPWAKIDPSPAVVQNFFTEEGVTYTVTAQDGVSKKTYIAKATIVETGRIANYNPTLFYSFDNQDDYAAPTIGSSALSFFDKTGNGTLGTPGNPPTGSTEGPYAGKNAITIGKDKHVKVLNTTGASDGGTKLNTYSLLFDVQIHTSEWYALLQTNPANTDDGDIFIRSSGTVGVGATGYSGEALNLNQWYRIIVTLDGSVENGDYNIYANGNLILHASGAATAKDGRLSLANEFCIFTDEDGEEADIDCAGFAFWGNRVLTPREIAELGPATASPTGR